MTEDLAFGGEPTALVIGESESTLADLLLQDAVLFDEVSHDQCLFAVNPTSKRGEEELKRE